MVEAVAIAIDPVCEMRVDEARAPARSEYDGQTVYFCSVGCKIAFDHSPARWLGVGVLTKSELGREDDAVVLRTEGLKRIYRRGRELVEALRGVDLEIRGGEFVTVMGPSGGGKSTLLHLIGGIDRPTEGEVWVDGVDVGSASEEELTLFRREKVGFVFQFYNLLPTLSASENVELPLIALGYPRRGRHTMAEAILGVVGLGDRLDHKPGELSGGEQQRVAIARAVVAHPSLVLADEPTGDLDSASSETVVGLMEDLNRSLGLTFVLATHNPAVGERGSRRLLLRDGRIVSDESGSGR